MFKWANCQDEISRSMETHLLKKEASNRSSRMIKLAQAIDLLNEAAETFERSGQNQTADQITSLLNNLIGDLK